MSDTTAFETQVDAETPASDSTTATQDATAGQAGCGEPADVSADAVPADTEEYVAAGSNDDAVDEDGDDDVEDDADDEDGDADDEAAATGGRRRSGRINALEREGEVAADFLETLLDIADLDGDIDVDVDGDRAAVAIVDSDEGRVPRRLIGTDGKVLEALQELTRIAVQASTGERSRLMLDIGGHRAGRRQTLVELAATSIEQVRSSGTAIALEPMSAFERKVVHDEVTAAGLRSESEGVEPKRHIVIHPA